MSTALPKSSNCCAATFATFALLSYSACPKVFRSSGFFILTPILLAVSNTSLGKMFLPCFVVGAIPISFLRAEACNSSAISSNLFAILALLTAFTPSPSPCKVPANKPPVTPPLSAPLNSFPCSLNATPPIAPGKRPLFAACPTAFNPVAPSAAPTGNR